MQAELALGTKPSDIGQDPLQILRRPVRELRAVLRSGEIGNRNNVRRIADDFDQLRNDPRTGQIEGSVLWLFEANATAKANLQKEATARGISPDRLVFAPHADYATYLARTQLADLFLDNNYWNGHSTASDALRCGVPVMTCQGPSFANRVASSLLRAIGMPELITHSLEEYETLTLKMARDPALLAETKAKLARNRLTMPLFNTERFARHLEAAYQTMHERAQRSEPPASFVVDAI